MAKPIAYFGYSKEGKTLHLQNLSLNSPTNYQWGFGDGNNSVEKNPTHTYTQDGFYTISLTVSNSDGTSETLEVVIGINDSNDSINSTIFESVNQYLPKALRGDASNRAKINLINNWQSYLQPLVVDPYSVDPIDTHNEFKWPGLVNTLISQLVARDLMTMTMQNLLLTDNAEDEGTTESIGQQIKSIETGPGKTEWYEDKALNTSAEDIKNLSTAFMNMLGEGGPFEQLTFGICQLASRLQIYLPMCKNPHNTTIVPKVFKRYVDSKHNANPFGITKRMK